MTIFGKEVDIEGVRKPYITLSMVMYSDVMHAVEALIKYEPQAKFLYDELERIREKKEQEISNV